MFTPLLLIALAAAPTGELAAGSPTAAPAEATGDDAPGKAALEMPPPPAGMRELGPDEERALAVPAAEEETPDDPEVSEQVAEDSLELEELRALEEATLTPESQADADLLRAVRRMGLANPLRARMLDALSETELTEDGRAVGLPRITDLAAFDPAVVEDQYDIPIAMQPLVAQYIQFFQGAGRRWFINWMNRSTRYIPIMQPILAEHGLPRDTVYLAMIESGFSAHAYSWAHAAGPWQFISSTGKQYGLKQDFWVDERRDPIKSTRAASRYLRDLHRELGHWFLAWAGYNTGAGRVRRVIRTKNTRDWWELSDGKGLAKETKHYVPKLIAAALVAKHPQAFGFSQSEFSFLPLLDYEEVPLSSPTDLDVIARAAGVDVRDVVDLNPELKRWCTPPASEQKPYVVRLPRGTKDTFAENFAKIAPKERLTFKVHRIKRGDTLSTIAAAYRSAPEAIMQINRLKNARRLKINQELIIPVSAGRAASATAVATSNAAAPSGADSALDRQVARARRSGFVAHRPEEEVPAGTPSRPVATGPIKTETVNGKTRITYVVQSGDNLWAISQRFNVSVDELRRWNDLGRRSRRLSVGTALYVFPGGGAIQVQNGTVVAAKAPPAAVSVKSGNGKTTIHQLAPGETLWAVAQRYNVSVADIKKWNRITNHRAVQAGTNLTVHLP